MENEFGLAAKFSAETETIPEAAAPTVPSRVTSIFATWLIELTLRATSLAMLPNSPLENALLTPSCRKKVKNVKELVPVIRIISP